MKEIEKYLGPIFKIAFWGFICNQVFKYSYLQKLNLSAYFSVELSYNEILRVFPEIFQILTKFLPLLFGYIFIAVLIKLISESQSNFMNFNIEAAKQLFDYYFKPKLKLVGDFRTNFKNRLSRKQINNLVIEVLISLENFTSIIVIIAFFNEKENFVINAAFWVVIINYIVKVLIVTSIELRKKSSIEWLNNNTIVLYFFILAYQYGIDLAKDKIDMTTNFYSEQKLSFCYSESNKFIETDKQNILVFQDDRIIIIRDLMSGTNMVYSKDKIRYLNYNDKIIELF